MRTSHTRTIAAAVAAAALLGTGLSFTVGPATAADIAAGPTRSTARPAASPTWFQLRSADLGNACIAEKGTTSAVAGTPCSSNHSDFWQWTSTGQLLNERSGKCLSVTGTDPGVYLNTCGTLRDQPRAALAQPAGAGHRGREALLPHRVRQPSHPRVAGPERHHDRYQRPAAVVRRHPLDPPLAQ